VERQMDPPEDGDGPKELNEPKPDAGSSRNASAALSDAPAREMTPSWPSRSPSSVLRESTRGSEVLGAFNGDRTNKHQSADTIDSITVLRKLTLQFPGLPMGIGEASRVKEEDEQDLGTERAENGRGGKRGQERRLEKMFRGGQDDDMDPFGDGHAEGGSKWASSSSLHPWDSSSRSHLSDFGETGMEKGEEMGMGMRMEKGEGMRGSVSTRSEAGADFGWRVRTGLSP